MEDSQEITMQEEAVTLEPISEETSSFIELASSKTATSKAQVFGILKLLAEMGAYERLRLLSHFTNTPRIGEDEAMAAAEIAHTSVVYVIGDGTGCSKIGKADTPSQRKQTLQTGTSKSLTLHSEVVCRNGRVHEVEARAHALLAHCRLVGEWFKIDPDGAALAVEQAYREVYGAAPA